MYEDAVFISELPLLRLSTSTIGLREISVFIPIVVYLFDFHDSLEQSIHLVVVTLLLLLQFSSLFSSWLLLVVVLLFSLYPLDGDGTFWSRIKKKKI